MDWKKIKATIKGWKPGDYVRQISVVVIGILITFAGSNLITNCSEKRDVQAIMLLIGDEMRSNRDMYRSSISQFNNDERISAMLVEHEMRLQTIPEDSLTQFGFVLGHYRTFSYQRNAIDLLKNSMLMQKISDKEFLLSLLEAYETLETYKVLITQYYDLKDKIVTPFHLSLTDEQFDTLLQGGYGMWGIYLSDIKVRNFMRTPMEYFHSNYKKSVERELDKMIQTIEEKYGSK